MPNFDFEICGTCSERDRFAAANAVATSMLGTLDDLPKRAETLLQAFEEQKQLSTEYVKNIPSGEVAKVDQDIAHKEDVTVSLYTTISDMKFNLDRLPAEVGVVDCEAVRTEQVVCPRIALIAERLTEISEKLTEEIGNISNPNPS